MIDEDAIHRRIEDLPELRYRMGAPGQLSVDEVAGGSRSEDEGGGQVEAGEQQPQVHGHEAQAHEGDDVGRREDLACHLLGDLFPISLPFDHEGVLLLPYKNRTLDEGPAHVPITAYFSRAASPSQTHHET